MKHISIEGFDGVGKTTISNIVAKELGFKFIEKPLHELFDEGDSFDEYLRIRDKVNSNPDRNFTSLFYGLGSVYMYGKSTKIITLSLIDIYALTTLGLVLNIIKMSMASYYPN